MKPSLKIPVQGLVWAVPILMAGIVMIVAGAVTVVAREVLREVEIRIEAAQERLLLSCNDSPALQG